MDKTNPKSVRMAVYNKARTAARAGKLDARRVNKAFGILQSKAKRPYRSTIIGCDCPDRKFNSDVPCKHMIACMMERRISQAAPVTQPDPYERGILLRIDNSDYPLYCSEQVRIPYGYIVHRFESMAAFDQFLSGNGHGTLIKAVEARGRKVRDEYHREGGF
jgi:hypothetical protein